MDSSRFCKPQGKTYNLPGKTDSDIDSDCIIL